MPPPVPASLLKAATFPCRHCPFPPPKNTDHVLRFSCGAHRATRILHYFSSYCHSPDKAPGLISADRVPRLGSLRMMASGGSGGAGSRRSVGGGGDGIRAHVSGSSSAVQQDGVGQMNGGFKEEEEEQQQRRPRLMTLPTVLTLGRVAAVPLLVSTFYMNDWWATTATTSIFLAAAVTDWLDGYLARRMQLGTAFGAFLDPVADKLMVAATLVLLCTSPLEVAVVGEVPWLLTVPSIAIIGREITMSAVREWAASQNSKVLEAVAVNNLGKWKTATQMTALAILLASRDPSLTGQGVLVASGVVLLYVSAGLAVLSLIVYMRNIWRILLK